jgi:hypothetical protein
MYKIEEKSFGFEVSFSGFLQGPEILEFRQEMETKVTGQREPFGVLVDLRESRTFPAEAQAGLMQIIGYCREHGMERNAVVVNSAITKIQAARLARETQIPHVRFLDAADNPEWRRQAEDWLTQGKEPDRPSA